MHLDAEQVQRLLHDELAPSTAAQARAHLDGCRECLTRVSDAEREESEVLELLRQMDHPVPRVTAESIVAGDKIEEHVEQMRSYVSAGYDEVYVANMGPHYKEMIEAYGREVLDAVRAG